MNNLEQIINIHEKLIYKITNKFPTLPKEDLYQAGVIGIIKAFRNFKDNGTTKFTTYAYNYIFGEMYDLYMNNGSIKLNKDILKTYKKIEQTKYLLCQQLGFMPSIQMVSEYLNIDETIVYDIYNATSTIMSLDNEENRPVYETIADEHCKEENLDIKDSLKVLTESERKIINLRYYQDFTQSETAKKLGMSQVSVSRYEKKSLTKMYNYLAS